MNIPDGFDGTKQAVGAFFDITGCPYYDELLISSVDRIKDMTTLAGIGIRPAVIPVYFLHTVSAVSHSGWWRTQR